MNIQDNTLRSTDGFFAIVSPRLDAIEEVTVTTAQQGADARAGRGADQVRHALGHQQLHAAAATGYYRNDNLNANTWFNNRNGIGKANLLQNQGGVRAGGPIVIPGLFDGRNKAFFFVNYEELRQPSDTTRQRTILNPAAHGGHLHVTLASGVTQTVNVLRTGGRERPARRRSIRQSTAMLRDIRTAVSGGSLETIDPNLQRYTFNVPVRDERWYPTFRLDYNLTSNHRASFAYNYQKFTDYPDTLNNRDSQLPRLPGRRRSDRRCASVGADRCARRCRRKHGQRSASRLQRRAGHVLRRTQHRTCSPAASRTSRGSRCGSRRSTPR